MESEEAESHDGSRKRPPTTAQCSSSKPFVRGLIGARRSAVDAIRFQLANVWSTNLHMIQVLRERDYGVLIVSPARGGVNRGSRRARVACSKL